MLKPALKAQLRRERLVADQLCYTAQVGNHVVKTRYGDYLQAFRLAGISFESADDAQLNAWHERLCVLWRNIASPNVALWTQVCRRRAAGLKPESGRAGSDFAGGLANKYWQRLTDERLMINELYLAMVYRPTVGAATGTVSRLLRKSGNAGVSQSCAEALEACEKLAQILESSLLRYEPVRLGRYHWAGRWYSSLLEYLALLVNAEWQRVPLPPGPLNPVLSTSRILFGAECIEYRSPTATRVGAMLGIKEYPTPTVVGMFDRLLAVPFPLVLTQSFSFLTKAAGQGLLQRQVNRLANAGDYAHSQAAELESALDALTSNEFVMGDHHFSLQVLAEAVNENPDAGGADRVHRLNEHVAQARGVLADAGLTVAREDLALEAAYWAQLPGNFPLRPRKAPITSRNFASMAPFHNFPCGRATGNHWGDALSLLMTSARSPYYFSLHASDPNEADGGSRRDTGHTFICGPTGSGKSVLVGFMVTMMARQEATQVIFDKDRGLQSLVQALGGAYLPLRSGVPTGCNPLQLVVTPETIEFLRGWLQMLVRDPTGRPLSVREQGELDQALHGALALDRPARRLSRVVEHLDATDRDGLHARLARWCTVTDGAYAWVFDNAVDSVAAQLAGQLLMGFDVTEFLDHELARPPLTLYLFHLVRRLLDGRRLVCWMDEFWRLLADQAFEKFAKDAPKTWRKMNGVLCLATQSTSDVLDSPISRTIVEQTATKIFFPNPDASAAEYCDSFGLSEREFKLIKAQLEPGSRQFLIKQGHHSVVCQLDLQGFDQELAVLSARAGPSPHISKSAVPSPGEEP